LVTNEHQITGQSVIEHNSQEDATALYY